MSHNPETFARFTGGIYRETVTPSRSGTADAPIRFEAAAGECVTVSGADPLLAAWTHLVVPDAPSGDWTGTMVFMVPGLGWQSNTRQVATFDISTRTITFDSPVDTAPGGTTPATGLAPRYGTPYYLYGSRLALDTAGEWVQDPTTGALSFWPPDGMDPRTLDIEVKQRSYAFDVQGVSYVDIAGFQVFSAGIRLLGTDHCVVDSVVARYVTHLRETDRYATLGDVPWIEGTNNVWKNSIIAYSGLLVHGADNRITNNVVHDVVYMADNHAGIDVDAAFASNEGNVITNNTVYRSGRAGIFLYNLQSGHVLHNRVYDIAMLTHDMGGIYAWNTDGEETEIAYNEVSAVDTIYGAGIYLDDGSQNFIVHHNYVHDTAYYGVTFKNDNAIFNNTLLAAGASPLNTGPNAQTGDWDNVDGAKVADNLWDGRVGVRVGLRPTNVTDYGDFFVPVSVGPNWTRIVVPFSQLVQPTWAIQVPLDLKSVPLLDFTPVTPGSVTLDIDNIGLEGKTPYLLADFETGVGDSLGGSVWSGGGSGSSLVQSLVSPGANGSGSALHLIGDIRLDSAAYAITTVTLGPALSDGGTPPYDLAAYTGVSFDIRATETRDLATTQVQPQQSENVACPLNAQQIPTTSCAIQQGVPFPPYTNGFQGSAPDLGAFESGELRWTSGASFADPGATCSATDAGVDGSDGGVETWIATGGCGCAQMGGRGDGPVLPGAALSSLLIAGRSRRRRRTAARHPPSARAGSARSPVRRSAHA
jgi:parallel beta-helix repeat protein